MIAKGNEEKRNLIWEIVTGISTILIILSGVFFLIKMFTSNPLEGSWQHEDSNLVITVKNGGSAELEWPEQFGDSDMKVPVEYSIDKDTKTFAIFVNEDAIRKAAEGSEGAVTEEELSISVNMIAATYDYNVENNELTLTDREYGEQMVFDKQ